MAPQDILIETKGIRTHFWDERTFKDKCGVERWQSKELIAAKLWYLTKWNNLLNLQVEFPEIDWTQTFKKLWEPTLLSPILRRLVEDPSATKATIPLFDFIKDPDSEEDEPAI
ncbi:MAG: hypothetical protein ACRCVL_03825, partial [Cetobacterium sp.]